LGYNELEWAKVFAKSRMNYHWSMDDFESPEDYLSLIERYMKLVPYLSPKTENKKTLFHPDLHLDNVFFDLQSQKITQIIDWQSASVCETFLQHKIPPMLPTSEENNGALDIIGHYEKLTQAKNPQRWASLMEDHVSTRSKPVSLVTGAWSREDVFSFRHALINVVAHWPELEANLHPCPLNFTERELELHQTEMELLEGLGTIMHQLDTEELIPLGGMVPRKDYAKAQAANLHFKEAFLNLAENPQQKDLHLRVWPYQDKQL
jgi:hypothetical protein